MVSTFCTPAGSRSLSAPIDTQMIKSVIHLADDTPELSEGLTAQRIRCMSERRVLIAYVCLSMYVMACAGRWRSACQKTLLR